jgi:hypothetical protein
MARRTVDQPTTDTPALHGHYDGPRGLEDEHRHLGGDKAHPHKRDSHLGRTAEIGEYVHGNHLPQARRDLAEQKRVGGLGDAPTDQIQPAAGALAPASPPAELVKAASSGDGGPDRDFAELTRIVEHAETQRFEGSATIELLSVLKAAIRQEARHELVDPELVGKGLRLFEGWAIKRGLRHADGGGSA